MNNNHNTTFKKLQQSNTYIPTSPTPLPSSNSSPQLNNNNGEMMKKIWKSCGKKALLKFKLVELKEELRKKSLTLNGNKAEIVERLHEKYMSEEQSSITNSIDNTSPESTSNSSSSPAIKSSLTTTPNSNSSINERKSAYMKRNSNSAAVTFAPFSAMNNNTQESPISPPKIDNTPPSRFGSTNSPPLSNSITSTTSNATGSSSNKKSSISSLPPPPTLSQLPSSLYNPSLFYNKGNNYTYPKLPSLPPYPQYGVPNYSYYPMFHGANSNALTPATTNTSNTLTSNTTTANLNLTSKKKKKKENAALKPAKPKEEEVDTDEFLSLEEIECYNSQIDYNSSSDETFTQKRCLSDTELYIETFENEALNNLLYSTPHKKKQKQEHEFYEDLFYDRNKDLVDEEEEQGVIETNQEVIQKDITHSNDIGFRVKCIIDGNTSEEKDVFIRDDKKWEDVVNHLLNDYRSFYNYFNFEFIPNDFNAILHSKCEDVQLLSNSTIQSSSISNRDSITIKLKVIDHTCQFDLQVDSITSLGLHSYEDDEDEKEEKEEDGYDQDDEDDEEEYEEEEEEESTFHADHHEEEEQTIQEDIYDQQVLLNLIESI